MKYPEHGKLSVIASDSQLCGEFLDWLTCEKNISLKNNSIPDLLSEFFNIDQAKIEQEKVLMLAQIRQANKLE